MGRNPGLSIAFGRDGSARQNPAGDGYCDKNVVGWHAPETNTTVVTVTVSMFTMYSLSSDYSTFVTLTVTPYSVTAPMPGGCCT
jgi:hypothetical protein